MAARVFCSSWGFLAECGGMHKLEEALHLVAARGFCGLEVPVSYALRQPGGVDAFAKALQRHKLSAMWGAFSSGPLASTTYPDEHRVAVHIATLQHQIHAVFASPAARSVTHGINCHSGSDGWTMRQCHVFFGAFLRWADDQSELAGRLMHETHRTRALFSPWNARELLLAHPSLLVTADLSHWTCVTESSPGERDDIEAVVSQLLAPRVRHIHARIGWAQGPQVADPRAPEWAGHVAGFERWWALFRDASRSRASGVPLSATPEHGPPPYQPTAPHTQQSLADVEAVNCWMRDRLLALLE